MERTLNALIFAKNYDKDVDIFTPNCTDLTSPDLTFLNFS